MPIRPENRDRYPADWREISLEVRFERAKGRCECDGRCGRPTVHLGGDGRCNALHGKPIPLYGGMKLRDPKRRGTVILTTAHLDHTPENVDRANLMAMCQGCHLHYDREHHAETRRLSQRDKGQLLLPL